MCINRKENWLALYQGEKAEWIGTPWEAFWGESWDKFVCDPVREVDDMGSPGGHETRDSFGVVWQWLEGAPGAHPHITPENVVIKDIKKWRDQVKFPDPHSMDWSKCANALKKADRNEYLLMGASFGGIFERTHYLMGMEYALTSYMEHPAEMAELAKAIADYKIAHIDEMFRAFQPDVLHYHDDWGTKMDVFLPPAVWRKIIKPQHQRIVDAAHKRGMIFMHHADCICHRYVEDMIEIGIDIWQGVIPQNNIVELQKIIDGKMCLMGGIDGPAIDFPGAPEEQIRSEVRRVIDTYCPQGRFVPCIPNLFCINKDIQPIMDDELRSYGSRFFK